MAGVTALVQARMGSSRLPGKMMMDLAGAPIIQWVLTRVKASRLIDRTVLCTSKSPLDDPLGESALQLGCGVFRGNEQNVLKRLAEAAREAEAEICLRICADNPFVDSGELDRLIEFYRQRISRGDDPDRLYAFNHIPALGNQYPDGLGGEAFSAGLLMELEKRNATPYHREHMNALIWEQPDHYQIRTFPCPPEISFPNIKLDVDNIEDLEGLRPVAEIAGINSSARQVVAAWFEASGAASL